MRSYSSSFRHALVARFPINSQANSRTCCAPFSNHPLNLHTLIQRHKNPISIRCPQKSLQGKDSVCGDFEHKPHRFILFGAELIGIVTGVIGHAVSPAIWLRFRKTVTLWG
jgi:hypothetical protein